MAAPYFDPDDVQKNRVLGGIGYLFFFVPLIACNNSCYGRYCANQGLLVWIVAAVVSLAFGIVSWLPLIGWLFGTIKTILQLLIAIVAIYYAFLAASTGDARALPFIGHITMIR